MMTAFKTNARKKLKSAIAPSTRYGLKIILEPKVDFSSFKLTERVVATTSPTPIANYKDFLTDDWLTTEDTHALSYFNYAHMSAPLTYDLVDKDYGSITIDIPADTPLSSAVFIRATRAQAQIIISISGKTTYYADMIRVIADAQSEISIFIIQQLKEAHMIVTERKAKVHGDSAVHWTLLDLDGHYIRSSVTNMLNKQGAQGTIKAMYLAAHDQKYDLYTSSLHNAPYTTSDILTKGAVTGNSKALSRGLVQIGATAAHSNGYEKQDALVLSATAEADAIPNLEIHNHDVRCTHGSTIGQVNKDQLFYLMSRGLSEQQAKQKIIEGFFIPLIQQLSPALQEKVIETIEARL